MALWSNAGDDKQSSATLIGGGSLIFVGHHASLFEPNTASLWLLLLGFNSRKLFLPASTVLYAVLLRFVDPLKNYLRAPQRRKADVKALGGHQRSHKALVLQKWCPFNHQRPFSGRHPNLQRDVKRGILLLLVTQASPNYDYC